MSNYRTAPVNPNIYADLKALTALKTKVTGFSFLPQQPVNSSLVGRHVSNLKGRGLNFEEMRQYGVGDDIRSLDWKVTMRTGKPYVKVYTEERERNVLLLIDQRQGMFFGSTKKMKSVIAAELAALIAWKTIADTDRIGAIICTDEKDVFIKPSRSENHVGHILAQLVKCNHQLKTGNTTSESNGLSSLLEKVARYALHDTLVFYIGDGDGWNEQCSNTIKKIRQHNEVIICYTYDDLEHELPSTDQMVLSDGELQIELTAKDASLKTKFQQQIQQEIGEVSRFANQYRIPLLRFNTIEDTTKQLRTQLGNY